MFLKNVTVINVLYWSGSLRAGNAVRSVAKYRKSGNKVREHFVRCCVWEN